MNSKRILVTGGAGYVGSVVVDELIARGCQVTVFDNLSTGHAQAVHPQAEFVEGDLADPSLVARTMSDSRPDVVMHFAALSLVGQSVRQPFRYLHDNTMHGLTLANCAAEQGVRGFVLSSTACIYGSKAEIPIAEDAPVAPENPYGTSKYLLETGLRSLCQHSKLSCIALRYFNAAGASGRYGEDHDPETHLIPRVLRVALGVESTVQVFGSDYETPDGTCVRDYVHVLDLADAHIRAADASGNQDFACYNLGTGTGYSVLQVVEAARRVTGAEIPVAMGKRRQGDPKALVASNELAAAELGGWQPTRSDLDSIIASAWQWMKAHPNGYRGA